VVRPTVFHRHRRETDGADSRLAKDTQGGAADGRQRQAAGLNDGLDYDGDRHPSGGVNQGSTAGADPSEKLATINMVAPPKIRPGRFRPPDKLLAMLKGQSLWGVRAATRPEFAGAERQLST